MAELATIARPYAEALFQTARADATTLKSQVNALATLANDPTMRQFAANPKIADEQVHAMVVDVLGRFDSRVDNLLRAIIENGRLSALPEIAAQFQALVNSSSGVSDALIESAFPIDDAQLADVSAALEKRFGRKLNPSVKVVPDLIGGIRVIVGDEVLDTSVKARLEQMKLAMTA